MKCSTEQENFWSADLGDSYTERSQGIQHEAALVHFFSKILSYSGRLVSAIEFCINRGLSLFALRRLIRSVLIHVNPEKRPEVYDRLHKSSHKYILAAEYYNPSPVALPYRGHVERLFKRDFASEILDRFPDLTLRAYGFSYRRDPLFPQDDVSWFLLQKP